MVKVLWKWWKGGKQGVREEKCGDKSKNVEDSLRATSLDKFKILGEYIQKYVGNQDEEDIEEDEEDNEEVVEVSSNAKGPVGGSHVVVDNHGVRRLVQSPQSSPRITAGTCTSPSRVAITTH